MIFFDEKEYTGAFKLKIESQLGPQISIPNQIKFGTIGSSMYQLNKSKINDLEKNWDDLETRSIFEKFENGLLLRINHRQKLSFISIPYTEITEIILKKGAEEITPFPFSPMMLLLALGVHIRYARYFRLHPSEYGITPMSLTVICSNDQLNLLSHGYNFYSEHRYFSEIKQRL
ncbi:hypothetical protein [Mangrovibacterium diazotrophicum]|uniref:Uncharacterized protein n=1 Tax=Mangrovibacterium diazotrophicum TaxID=1261403 RepID=A0A419WBK8_9BACT|nr:hypothetical protein [Mangrovibacterium diazotrophicum]RKD92861.1 hypothetical protein BC643_3238 [Mangrovibacterium diazotrophicum]